MGQHREEIKAACHLPRGQLWGPKWGPEQYFSKCGPPVYLDRNYQELVNRFRFWSLPPPPEIEAVGCVCGLGVVGPGIFNHSPTGPTGRVK